MSAVTSLSGTSLTSAHRCFEAALPAIDRTLRYLFRRWPRGRRAEAICDARSACWHSWHGLLRRGVDPESVGVTGIAANAASIEPRETIRKTASTTPKAAAAPRPTGQDIASNTPSPVAADLPPEKFNQIERPCPSNAASPARQTAQGSKVCKSGAVGGTTDGSV